MGLPVINIVSPIDQVNLSNKLCSFEIAYADAVDLYSATIVVEIDTVNTFDSINKITNTALGVANGTSYCFSEILSNNVWYWRATVTNTSGSTISTIRTITIAEKLKRVLYDFENVIYNNRWTKKRTIGFYENVGKKDVWSNIRSLYDYENIVIDPPFPTLDRLSRTRGTSNSIIKLYGSGFGAKVEADTANEDRALRGYGGQVYFGDQLCNIISWSWNEIQIQIPNGVTSAGIKVALTAPTESGIRYSQVIGFEIYQADPTTDTGIEIFVCDKLNHNQILCQLDQATNKSFQSILNNCGSGKFSISRYDLKGSNTDYIKDQNYILCRLDGVNLFKFVIESISPSYVDSSGQEMIDVSGRGLLSIMEKAVVYPEGMPTPQYLDRNWTDTHGAAILRQLILEAQSRGCFWGITMDWSGDFDSIGNEFDDLTDISFHAGTPLTEVIEKLTNGMGLFDIEMTPDMTLRIYKTKGIDQSSDVIYRPGMGIIDCKKDTTSSGLQNVVLVEGEGGCLVETSNAESYETYGRKEGYLQAMNVPNLWAKLDRYGQSYLKNSAFTNWTIQGSVVKVTYEDGKNVMPFVDYLLGDWIKWIIPPNGSDDKGFNQKVRVKGITAEENNTTGVVTYALDLNNVKLEREIRLSQSVERMSNYSSGSLSSQTTKTPSTTDHNHKHGTLLDLDADDHKQYLTAERHDADDHSSLQRVKNIRTNGSDAISGDINLLSGDNIEITQDNENKTITFNAPNISDAKSILTKPIDIEDFSGKDGYILAYNEGFNKFYLKKDDGTGGGGSGSLSPYVFIFTSTTIETAILTNIDKPT